MRLATLPRVLGPDEMVKLPVNIFAMDDEARNVSIKVNSNDMFTIEGESSQSLSFSQPDDQVTNFDLKVKPATGAGKVSITASSGSKKANYTIDIPIRNPNPAVVDVKDAMVEPGKSWQTDFAALGLKGTNKTVLEVSSMPPLNLGKRLQYLISYPHGCVEQTVSSAFPQLYLSQLMEVTDPEKNRIEINIKAAIERLNSFQQGNGGFTYWPRYGSDVDDWGTNYAGHFILEAQEKGYAIPQGMLMKFINYQKSKSISWQKKSGENRDDLIQAYRLYTLAVAKQPETGAMNRLRESSNLSIQAKWRLAAAYALSGQKDYANELVNNISMTIPVYKEMWYTYGSELRDEAMILETLILLENRAKGMDLLKKISAALSNNNAWYSTQTTAYCLIASSKFLGNDKADGLIKATYTHNGQTGNTDTELPMAQKELQINESSSNNFMLSNNGKTVLFARLITEGIPAAGDQSSAENGLTLNVNYKSMEGKSIDVSALEQGTDFVAEVTIKNTGLRGDYKQLALTQVFASGWEIHNGRMDGTEQFSDSDKPDYQDIRDDRVLSYFNLKANQSQTFRVLLNASYAGKFYLPTIYCEAMYDNTINARKPGKWVSVSKAGVN